MAIVQGTSVTRGIFAAEECAGVRFSSAGLVLCAHSLLLLSSLVGCLGGKTRRAGYCKCCRMCLLAARCGFREREESLGSASESSSLPCVRG